MIIVCGGIKGGSGKTTAAVNLAIMRAGKKRDVLLIDADDQETASGFTQLRSEKHAAGLKWTNLAFQPEGCAVYTSIQLSGAAVRTQVLRLRDKYDDIVIDTGGRDTTSQRAALTVADLLLVPFVPRSFDLWTLEAVGELVEEMRPANPNLRAATFLNRADPRGPDNAEAAEILREIPALEFSGVSLGTRKAFANAAAEGLAVTELRHADEKALEEIWALYNWVFLMRKIEPVPDSGGNQFDITRPEAAHGNCA
jgi:chromosome partitioning protein